MKAIEIENLLKETLLNKPFNSYGYEVANNVLNFLEANGFDRSKLTYDRNGTGSNVTICVSAPRDLGGNYSFINIEIKKSRGAYHRWGYDWNYKDFLVTTYNHDTVEDSCRDAVSAINARKARLDEKFVKARNIFQLLKDAGYSEYDARELVDFAKNNKYELARQVYRPDDKY